MIGGSDHIDRFVASKKRRCSAVAVLALAVAMVGAPGCAYVHRDSKTGVTELWGFGRLKMGAPPASGRQTGIVQGVTMCGAAVGLSGGSAFLMVGWDDQQVVNIGDNTQVNIEGPECLSPCWTIGDGPANTEGERGNP